MAKKISQIVAANPASAFDGTEQFEVVQGGVSKGGLLSQILTYVSGGAAGNIPAQRYTVDTGSTADSDPTAGLVKFNNADPTLATAIYLDDSTSDGVDLSTFLASLGASGWLKVQSAADAGEWAIFKWSAVTDDTGYFDFTVACQASKGALDDADAVLVSFDSDANTGGSGGTELKGLTFTSDTGDTGDSDPGAGLVKWNHATQGSATKLFFDNATLDSISITSFFAALGTNGVVLLQQGDDATRWQLWEIDTATADTGYYDMAVTLLAKSSADIEDAKTVYCSFQKGPGTGGGSTQGKHSMPVMAGAIRPSLVSGCEYLTVAASGSNMPDIVMLNFDPSSKEYGQFAIPTPKKWNGGTVSFRPLWRHSATTTNFGVCFGLQGVAARDGVAIGAAFGTAQTSVDTGGATDTLYIGPVTSAITIAGTPQPEDLVFFRVFRDPDDGGDTMGVDASLLALVPYWTTNADTDD